MLDIDRWTKGWAPQLTQRETRMIAAKLKGDAVLPEDAAHMPKLVEWFETQSESFAQARGELTDKNEENVYAL